jgi:hypothetical protein
MISCKSYAWKISSEKTHKEKSIVDLMFDNFNKKQTRKSENRKYMCRPAGGFHWGFTSESLRKRNLECFSTAAKLAKGASLAPTASSIDTVPFSLLVC